MRKRIAVTLAVLMLLGAAAVAGTSFADSHTSRINAFINREIKMTWNGQAFEPKESDGTQLYPIMYEGRTYLPAKFIADKAGVNIHWNDNTQTVSFDNRVVNIDLTTPYKDAEGNTGSSSGSSNSSSVTTSASMTHALANLPFTKFDLEIEGDNDDYELEVEFELYSSGNYKAKVDIELDDRKDVDLSGEKALAYLLPILEDLKINANMSQRDIAREVIRAFDWNHGFEEFELEVRFQDGTKIEIDIED